MVREIPLMDNATIMYNLRFHVSECISHLNQEIQVIIYLFAFRQFVAWNKQTRDHCPFIYYTSIFQ